VVQGIKANRKPYLVKKIRFAYYDRLLLQLLRDKPGKGSLIFTQLFKRNSANSVFKFLDERSTIAEDLRILRSLPFGLFIRAALKDAVWRNPRFVSPLFIATTVLLLLQSLGGMPIGYWALAIGFLVLGIPHGALDHLHALRKPWGWNMLGYVLVYLTLGALILGLFYISPWIGLLCFLGYSMWHFGEADLAHWNLGKSWKSLLWGCYVLGGILVSHAPETVQILREMKVFIPLDSVPSASMAYAWILLGGVFFMGWLRKGAIAISIVSLLLLCNLPLIPAFGLFFIFQHSLHGWKKIKEMSLKSDLRLWINALPFTLGAVVLFGLNTYYASFTWGQVFIFLAALSFPHVVLMASLYRKSSKDG
jgi:Brp/Blh family beta-carotene 15,15'-monooxygenase